jgi:epsilon-lactone hydrolase
VQLDIWPEMIHAWSLFYQQLDAGQEALASMGAFVQSMFEASQR